MVREACRSTWLVDAPGLVGLRGLTDCYESLAPMRRKFE